MSGREPGHANERHRLTDANTRADMHARGEAAQVSVSGDVAVPMPNLEQVSVSTSPSGASDDAIADRPHRRSSRRRVVGSFVIAPAAENGMFARAEHARYPAELERRAKKRGAH